MSDTLTPLSCLDFNVDEALPPPVSASLANATRYNQQSKLITELKCLLTDNTSNNFDMIIIWIHAFY